MRLMMVYAEHSSNKRHEIPRNRHREKPQKICGRAIKLNFREAAKKSSSLNLAGPLRPNPPPPRA